MSSTSSSSSDSENTSPVKNQKTSRSSSSDGDSEGKAGTSKRPEVVKQKAKQHLPQHSTPLQNSALTSSKLLFQKMLLGSNSKMAEFLRNKQNTTPKNLMPIKGILKSSKSPMEKNHRRSNDAEQEFEPIASSTQIREISMSDSPLEKNKKIKSKKKKHVSETESSSSSDDDDKKKNRTKLKKGILIKQENIQSSSDSEDEKKKPKKVKLETIKLRKVQKDVSSDESINTRNNRTVSQNDSSEDESDDEGNRQNPNGSFNKSSTPKRLSHSNNDVSGSETDSSQSQKVKKHKRKSSSESESEGENSPSTSNKLSSQFKKFESYHEGIQKINAQLNFIENIKSNEEIFMVRIPKNLDSKSLMGTKISLTETTRVPEGSREYDCIPSRKHQTEPLVIFTNTDKVHLVKPTGNLKIQKHIKSKSVPDLSGIWNDQVAFPDNLKQRHPLFGADYSDKVNLEDHIQEKINAAVEDYYKKQKKKKKKHKELAETKEEPEEIFKFLNRTDSPRKSVGDTKESIFEDSDGNIKKKKKKKEKLANLELESEELPVKKKKDKKHKKHSLDELGSSFKSDQELSNKKDVEQAGSSKKHKSGSLDDASKLINEMLLSKSMEILSAIKEKKKRKYSESVTESEPDHSGEVTKKKKHKKENKT